MEVDDILKELKTVEDSVYNAKHKLDELSEHIEKVKKQIIDDIVKRIEQSKYTRFNPEALQDFLEEPYAMLPRRTVKGKYVKWFAHIPREIEQQFQLRPLPLKVVDGLLLTGSEKTLSE